MSQNPFLLRSLRFVLNWLRSIRPSFNRSTRSLTVRTTLTPSALATRSAGWFSSSPRGALEAYPKISLLHFRNKVAEKTGSASSFGAAVAVILSQRGGKSNILFIKRREIPGDPWSGDVALPGGRKRLEDRDLLSTVVREVAEEVGIDLSGVEPLVVIGPFSPRNEPGLMVIAYIFSLGAEKVCASSGEEVSEIFWVPIDELISSRREITLPGRGRVQAYLWRGKVIWGLTERILSTLLERGIMGKSRE